MGSWKPLACSPDAGSYVSKRGMEQASTMLPSALHFGRVAAMRTPESHVAEAEFARQHHVHQVDGAMHAAESIHLTACCSHGTGNHGSFIPIIASGDAGSVWVPVSAARLTLAWSTILTLSESLDLGRPPLKTTVTESRSHLHTSVSFQPRPALK